MRAAACAILVCLGLSVSDARAQGFGIYEQGTCVMRRGGAGVAGPCTDGSAVYVNPAGLTDANRIVVSGGATLIFGTGAFTSDAGRRTAVENPLRPPPHGYVIWKATDRLALGGGLYTPYGLGLEWPLDFDGRFVSHDSSLETFYLQPTIAYAFTDRISAGGGLVVALSRVELNRREDLAGVPLPLVPGVTFDALLERGTDFADTSLSSDMASGAGVHLGVIVRAHDRVGVGARYLSSVTLDYEGTATFTPVPGEFVVTKPNILGLPVGTPLGSAVSTVQGALRNQPVRTELEMPAQFVAGVSVRPVPGVTIVGDYHWTGFSAFDTVLLDFSEPIPPDEPFVQNFRDTSAVRLGVDIEARPNLRVGGGYVNNQAAAPDETVTPLLPESRRNHLTVGAGFDLNSRFTLDVAYQYVHHADRRGRVVNPPPGVPPTTALNSGVYRSRADLVGITLTYRR